MKLVISLTCLFLCYASLAQLPFPELINDIDLLELGDEYTVTFTDELIDPSTVEIERVVTPEIYHPNHFHAFYIFDFQPSNSGDFFVTSGYLLKFEDEILLTSSFVNPENNGVFTFYGWFRNKMDWGDVLNLDYPSSFLASQEEPSVLSYESWDYYHMSDTDSYLYGSGPLEGTQLACAHSPLNYYFNFQHGVGANNNNLNYGFGGWFTSTGSIFYNEEEFIDEGNNQAGGFELDCIPVEEELVLRHYTIIDSEGNITEQDVYLVSPYVYGCQGDFNYNGLVDAVDLTMMLADFGCQVGCSETDLGSDGSVTTADVIALLSLFGSSCND